MITKQWQARISLDGGSNCLWCVLLARTWLNLVVFVEQRTSGRNLQAQLEHLQAHRKRDQIKYHQVITVGLSFDGYTSFVL